MSTTTVNPFIEYLSSQYGSLSTITSVPTAMTIPVSQITSVLSSVISEQSIALSELATASNSVSLEEKVILAQATIDYYSILNDIATATTTSAAQLTKAAQASAVMKEVYDDFTFYHGHTPSLAANIIFCVLFSLALCFQVFFNVFYKQWLFLFWWGIGLLGEIIAYSGRIWLHFNLFSTEAYIMQAVCINSAACFILLGLYHIVAQITHIYGDACSLLKKITYSRFFILCGFGSVIMQGVGSGFTSTSGRRVIIAGLALQIARMVVLQLVWYYSMFQIYQICKIHGDMNFDPAFAHIRQRKIFKALLVCISLGYIFMMIRSIYRLVEISEGYSSALTYNQTCFIVLESVMVTLTCFAMTFVNPGVTYGKHAHLKIDQKLGKGPLLSKVFA